MKIGVISDIHANLEALEAVLAECEKLGAERYLCLGDIVGYNADPSACLERVRGLPLDGCVMGNHDQQATSTESAGTFNPAAAQAIEWTRKQLNQEQRAYLADLPMTYQKGKVTIVHATLDAPKKWGYVFEKHAAAASFSYQFSQVCFCGHSHVPLAYEKFGAIQGGRYQEIKIVPGHKYLINCGSVGQPRDGDWRAAFVIYDGDDDLVKLYRIPYDVKKAQDKIRDAGLPEKHATRLGKGQ